MLIKKSNNDRAEVLLFWLEMESMRCTLDDFESAVNTGGFELLVELN